MGPEDSSESGTLLNARRSRLIGKVFLRLGPIYSTANFLTSARFVVRGNSMAPNFAEGQYILLSRLAYLWDVPERGDVAVVHHPRQRGKHYIKRIIGLPGEHIRVGAGCVFINGCPLEEPYLEGKGAFPDSYDENSIPLYDAKITGRAEARESPPDEWALGESQYFVMGDSRAHSDDSRSFGPLNRDLIVGKAWIRYWPRSVWGIIR